MDGVKEVIKRTTSDKVEMSCKESLEGEEEVATLVPVKMI
jgi:hypothetical protein